MTRGAPSFPSHQSTRVLLVEGQDDKHVVEQFYWKRFKSAPPFQVLDQDGYEPLCDAIWSHINASDREVVGVIVDADGDLQSRWAAVTDRLRRADPDIEIGDPSPGGMIAGNGPRVGLWLWPDNESSGEIEDFVAKMIPRDDPVWPLSKRYIEGIPLGQRPFSEGKTARAEIHAWLAVREKPRRMGAAFRTGDLKLDEPLAEQFASWLKDLFKN